MQLRTARGRQYAVARRIVQVACVVAFGLTLGSCDKCGDWIFKRGWSQACKGGAGPQ